MARGQCVRKSASRSEADPRCAPRTRARSSRPARIRAQTTTGPAGGPCRRYGGGASREVRPTSVPPPAYQEHGQSRVPRRRAARGSRCARARPARRSRCVQAERPSRSSPPISRATSWCSTSTTARVSWGSRTGPGRGASSPSTRRAVVVAHTEHGASRSSTRRRGGSRRARRLRGAALHRRASDARRARVRHRLGARRGRRPRRRGRAGRLADRVPGPARHVSVEPGRRTLWTALGTEGARVAVLDLERSAATAARPDDRAAVPRPRRRLRPRRRPRLGHVRRGAPHRRLPARRPVRVLDAGRRRSTSPSRRKAFVASGDDGTVRRHRLDGDARPRGARPRRLLQRHVRLAARS